MEYPAQLVHVPMPGLYETFLERYIMSMLRNPYPTASRFFSRHELYELNTKHLTVLNIEVYNDHTYHLHALVPFWPLFSHLTALQLFILRFHAVCDAMPPILHPGRLFYEDAYEIPIGLFKDLAKEDIRLQEGELTGFPYEIDEDPWECLKSKIDIVPTDSDGEYLSPTSVRRLELLFINPGIKNCPKNLYEYKLREFNQSRSPLEIYRCRKELLERFGLIKPKEQAFAAGKVAIERFEPSLSRFSQPILETPDTSTLRLTPGAQHALVTSDVDAPSVSTSMESQGARRSCWNLVLELLLFWYHDFKADFMPNELEPTADDENESAGDL
ncbi:hypothetical protein SNK03_003149 [Fusarium graminearum]